MRKILVITYALEEELDALSLRQLQEDCEKKWMDSLGLIDRFFNKHLFLKDRKVVFLRTGVGKVNSYRYLEKVLELTKKFTNGYAEITVLNLGTAASVLEEQGMLVSPDRFVDRDISKLGMEYLNSIEDFMIGPDANPGQCRKYSCNSGDTFATNTEESYQLDDGYVAICDMEAFQQAALCQQFKGFSEPVKFECWKFITDKIGENSLDEWKHWLPEAREELTRIAMSYISDLYES